MQNKAQMDDKQWVDRWQRSCLEEARQSRRVLLLEGARQCGKTTLARSLPGNTLFRTLDDIAVRDAVSFDLKAFLDHDVDMLVIDEIQRAPELLPEIKRIVDEDTRPGRFLLTGSARLASLPNVTESLAGRVRRVRLRPFSQGELHASDADFLERLACGDHFIDDSSVDRNSLLRTALRGGYPEVQPMNMRERRSWHNDYIDAILSRDLQDVGKVRDVRNVRNLIVACAAWSCRQADAASLSRELGVTRISIDTWLGMLETLFLLERLPAWTRTDYARVGKKDKWLLSDPGLIASLLRYPDDPARLSNDQTGKILEAFIATELLALADASSGRFSVGHYRDNDKREIDFMIDDHDTGGCIGIEVKASTTVGAKDFKHLKWFEQNIVADRPFAGAVLYAGSEVLKFGERLQAIPVSALWHRP